MRFRSSIVAAFVAALAVGATACAEEPPATPPPGPSTPDQVSYSPASPLKQNIGAQKAQTFTAGRSGTMDKVALALEAGLDGLPVGPVYVTIRPTSLGLPTETILGSATYSGPYPPAFTTGAPPLIQIPLTIPAQVTAGVRYAIVFGEVSPATDQVIASAQSNNQYLAGEAIDYLPTAPFWFPITGLGGVDVAFETWVY